MKIRTYVRGGLLVIFTSGVGYYLLLSQTGDMTLGLWGAVIGAVVAGLMIYLERGLEKVPLGSILYGGGGLVLGLILANLLTYSLFLAAKNSPISSITKVLLTIFLGYMGAIVGMKKGKELAIEGYANNLQKGPSNNNVKILDTSVIIDGRIADICETGFIEGELVVPQFVLKELQHIADSSDTEKCGHKCSDNRPGFFSD